MRVIRDEQNDELIAQMPARIAEVRRGITHIDRSETCFKGKGTITAFDLNPNPALSERLQKGKW